MALVFTGGDGDEVDIGSDTSLDDLNDFTYLMWFYPTGTPGGSASLAGKGTFGGQNRRNVVFNENRNINLAIDRVTQDAQATSATALSIDTWHFVACTFDLTDGVRLWIGDLSTLVVEDTYSVSPILGSGATITNASDNFKIGGEGGSSSIPGRIAFCGIYNARMTLAELQRQQFRPHVTPECVGFYHLGYNGTGTQPDWSGTGNAGTVTGAVVADHVPLGSPFGFDAGWMGAFGAAAVAIPTINLSMAPYTPA